MANLSELLKEGRTGDAWLKYCGFVELSLTEFMEIQERLLKEQLQLLSKSFLGKKILGETVPKDSEEFRRLVPFTTYEDYLPYLAEKREDILPSDPKFWICTSGKTGAYEQKWAPYPPAWVQTHMKNFVAAIIFSICNKKGSFSLKENSKFLYAMAPPPYLTGMVPHNLKDEFSFAYLPPLAEAEKMNFDRQNLEGFRLGLNTGIDLFFGISAVLVRIGEKFAKQGIRALGGEGLNLLAWLRLSCGFLKSKISKREFLPKDVWNLKGIMCAGTDTSFYKERIEYYWGVKPLEIYGGTEIGIAATQAWDYEGMMLFPDANFWEFIPEDEHAKSQTDPSYAPRTVLLSELKPGRRYELVVTNFKGGAFVRYRLGDMIKVLSRSNENLKIDLPQILYEDRVEDVIDLASFTRITERTLGNALSLAGIGKQNWLAHKAFADNHPLIELVLELPDSVEIDRLEEKIHLALREVDSDYRDLGNMVGYRPLKVTAIPLGTLNSLREQTGTGEFSWAAGLGARINPPAKIMALVAAAAEKNSVGRNWNGNGTGK
jgi:hypothetical protein